MEASDNIQSPIRPLPWRGSLALQGAVHLVRPEILIKPHNFYLKSPGQYPLYAHLHAV